MSEESKSKNEESDVETIDVEGCPCPDNYPDWDGKSIDLSGSLVHGMKVSSIFHMPVAFDMYVSKQAANVYHLELEQKWPGFVLSKTGMWGGQIIRLLKDDQSSPSRLVYRLPSPFQIMVKMHEGGVGTVPKAVHNMQIEMVEKGCMPKEFYLAHLTCPVCSEQKNGDKILIVRRYVANERIKKRMKDESLRNAKRNAKRAAIKAENKADKKLIAANGEK